MKPRAPGAALALSLGLMTAAPAAAQQSSAALLRPLETVPQFSSSTANHPNFRTPEGDLRQAGAVRRNGLIATYRVGPNLQIGVGRFSVPEIARPRTNMEGDRSPTAVRPRDRGIAAIGFSLSF